MTTMRTRATSKSHYLMRPDLGRSFDDEARSVLPARCPAGADLQVVIGDGLSAAAVIAPAAVTLAGGAQSNHLRPARPMRRKALRRRRIHRRSPRRRLPRPIYRQAPPAIPILTNGS